MYGSTGTQGRPVAEGLLTEGHHVRAVTRVAEHAADLQARGAEIAVADLTDRAALKAASEGVDAVFLHLPNVFDIELGLRWLDNALQAAADGGVRLLVYTTSSPSADEETDVSLFEIRRRALLRLPHSPVPVIALRPGAYLDNFAAPWIRGMIVEHGILPLAYTPDHLVTWVSNRDQATVAIAALGRPDRAGAVYKVGGLDTVTPPQLADAMSVAVGRPVRYVPLDLGEFHSQLAGQVGAHAADAIVAAYQWHRDFGTGPAQIGDADRALVLRDLGVTTRSLEVNLREVLGGAQR